MSDKEFTAVPMKPEEAIYTYRNSQQISLQTGLIGYLRADMGTNGDEFWSTWNEFRKELNTPEFNGEMDDVIHYLMNNGRFLSSREALRAFCDDNQNTLKFGERFGTGRDYGVRINTQDYAYLMRLNPHKGEYNLYCYCYRKDWLDSHIEKADRGIRFIDSHYNEQFRLYDGDEILIKKPDNSFDTYNGLRDRPEKYAVRYIDDYHFEYGNNLRHICEFAELLESSGNIVIPLRASLPDQCYVFVQSENKIGIVNKGEQGYTDSKSGNGTPEENQRIVKEMNNRLGVTKAQAEAMKSGSMFGWHTPVADPKSYDENGRAIKPKHKDRER